MENLWNDAKFTSPPVNTYKCLNKRIVTDFAFVYTAVSDAVFFLENQEVLHKEAAILSRLMYLMGRKFRHDIGHSYLRRTNTALIKYLNLNFLSDLKIFLHILPSTLDSIYLPTRQMLEYILIRLQTFGSLMCRIIVCTRKAAIFYFERLRRGDGAWLSLMPYTVLSRIWLLTDRILKNSCKWFNSLLPFRNRLDIIGVPLIPPDYIFPTDLFTWLGIEKFDKQLKFLWKSGAQHLSSQYTCSIISDQEDLKEESNDFGKLNDSINDISVENKNSPSQQVTNHVRINSSEDFGEKISRQDFYKQTQLNTSKESKSKEKSEITPIEAYKPLIAEDHNIGKSKKKNSKLISRKLFTEKQPDHNSPVDNSKCIESNYRHSINLIKCAKSLIKFFKKEDLYRLKNDKRSLTLHVSFMQWETLKKLLTKKVLKLKAKGNSQERIISQYVKEIWLERGF